MKFQQYLKETQLPDIESSKRVTNFLKLNCMPFINELKSTGTHKILFRGSNKPVKDIARIKPRKDRKPFDTSEYVHRILDNEFKKKFGWKARSEGVFTTASEYITGQYGKSYLFFPIGKYKYVYSLKIRDLYLNTYFILTDEELIKNYKIHYGPGNSKGTWYYKDEDTGCADTVEAVLLVSNKYKDGLTEREIRKLLRWVPNLTLDEYIKKEKEEIKIKTKEIINSYVDDNLRIAILGGVEIMFKCDKYYLVEKEYRENIIEYFKI